MIMKCKKSPLIVLLQLFLSFILSVHLVTNLRSDVILWIEFQIFFIFLMFYSFGVLFVLELIHTSLLDIIHYPRKGFKPIRSDISIFFNKRFVS